MIGKQLSPWTMAWFATALTALLVALGLAALGAVGPGNWSGGAALAVVHVFVLGWLGQMMLGALIQFVPVLCARPLVLPGLALPALILVAGRLAHGGPADLRALRAGAGLCHCRCDAGMDADRRA